MKNTAENSTVHCWYINNYHYGLFQLRSQQKLSVEVLHHWNTVKLYDCGPSCIPCKQFMFLVVFLLLLYGCMYLVELLSRCCFCHPNR